MPSRSTWRGSAPLQPAVDKQHRPRSVAQHSACPLPNNIQLGLYILLGLLLLATAERLSRSHTPLTFLPITPLRTGTRVSSPSSCSPGSSHASVLRPGREQVWPSLLHDHRRTRAPHRRGVRSARNVPPGPLRPTRA